MKKVDAAKFQNFNNTPGNYMRVDTICPSIGTLQMNSTNEASWTYVLRFCDGRSGTLVAPPSVQQAQEIKNFIHEIPPVVNAALCRGPVNHKWINYDIRIKFSRNDYKVLFGLWEIRKFAPIRYNLYRHQKLSLAEILAAALSKSKPLRVELR